MTDVILPLARAWREHFRAPRPPYDGEPVPDIAHDHTANASHCAALAVTYRSTADAEWFASRLGELLRLVHLATASHVDPLVLNALWNDDALCGMGPSPCARCDALDRDGVTPTVTIQAVRALERSNAGIVHDALYAWQEASASDAFLRLRDALLRGKETDTSAPRRPPVLVTVELEFFGNIDEDRALRDMEALAARRREVLPLEGTDALPFRLARIEPRGNLLEVRSPLFVPLLTALVDAGVTMRLPTNSWFNHSFPPIETPRLWQWLLDRAATDANSPRVLVDDVLIMYHVGLTVEMLAALLQILVTENPTLRRLLLNWPLSTETDAAARQRMGHVIGAAIFAPHAGLRLDELYIDLGNLSDDDVVALQQGAAEAQSRGDGRSSNDQPVESHVRTVKWRVFDTSSANIDPIARLVGALHVREFEVEARLHSLPCRLLKAVLEACAETITTLKWDALAFDDVHELETTAPWSHLPRRLRNLRVHVTDEQEPHALRVVNALLTHVGAQLTDLALVSHSSMLSDRMAESMIARCPRLRTLEVGNASREFIECLVRAYDDGRCRVSTFKSITWGPQWSVELLPLFQALRDTASGASCTLRALTIVPYWLDNPRYTAWLDALLASLATNTTLLRTELLGRVSDEDICKFRALPFQFAVRLPLVRQRLALLSVCERREDEPRPLVKLSPDVLEIVWSFAGRRVRRYKIYYESFGARHALL